MCVCVCVDKANITAKSVITLIGMNLRALRSVVLKCCALCVSVLQCVFSAVCTIRVLKHA